MAFRPKLRVALSSRTSVAWLLMALQFVALLFFGLRQTAFLSRGWGSVTLPLSLISFFGLLIWCANCVRTHPDLVRTGLRSVMLACLCYGIIGFVVPILGYDRSTVKERELATRMVRQLIVEEKLPAPANSDDLVLASRHGIGLFFVRYRSKDNNDQGYSISSTTIRSWRVRDLVGTNEIVVPREASR